jgi:hypothetical protein
MTFGMRFAVVLLASWLCGASSVCAACSRPQLPSVGLRLRARFEHAERRSARTLEARLECGWALDRGDPARAGGGASAGWPAAGAPTELDPTPCGLPRACAWEAESRAAAWAAFVPSPSPAKGAAR